MARTIRCVPTVILAAAVLLTAGMASAFTRDPATVFVNELHYDNTGVDQNEAVEIAGPAETDLAGWRLVLYNGSDGVDYFSQELSGIIPDQGGGFGTILFGLPTANFQNGGPDGLALVDAHGQVVQLLSYEGAFSASSGPAAGLGSTDLGVSEPGNTPVGQSLQLTGQGTGVPGLRVGRPHSQQLRSAQPAAELRDRTGARDGLPRPARERARHNHLGCAGHDRPEPAGRWAGHRPRYRDGQLPGR